MGGGIQWVRKWTAWWLSPTPLKHDGVNVTWDDDIPNWMEKNMFQTNDTDII